jgi:hypothetical protein
MLPEGKRNDAIKLLLENFENVWEYPHDLQLAGMTGAEKSRSLPGEADDDVLAREVHRVSLQIRARSVAPAPC